MCGCGRVNCVYIYCLSLLPLQPMGFVGRRPIVVRTTRYREGNAHPPPVHCKTKVSMDTPEKNRETEVHPRTYRHSRAQVRWLDVGWYRGIGIIAGWVFVERSLCFFGWSRYHFCRPRMGLLWRYFLPVRQAVLFLLALFFQDLTRW